MIFDNKTTLKEVNPPYTGQSSWKYGQVADVKMTYSHHLKPSQRPKFENSYETVKLLRPFYVAIEHRESFHVLGVDRGHKVLAHFEASQGGVAGTIADPKIIFQMLIKTNASGFVVSHNHPSGNLKPSQSDIELTKKLKEAGKLLEIQMLDHVILTSEHYYSFADEGML